MNWHDGKSIAEIIYEYGAVRGDLSEQYARDQLVSIIEGRIAELFAPLIEQARQEGAREALRSITPDVVDRAIQDAAGIFDLDDDELANIVTLLRAATPGSGTAGGGTQW